MAGFHAADLMNPDIPLVYTQIGENGFQRIAAAFYRNIATDPILDAVYPKADRSGAERRLFLFLMQYFGGPTTYSQERGHPRLRMRHQPFRIATSERESWVQAMLAALGEAAIPEPAYSEMKAYFEAAATFLINAIDVT